MRKSILIASIIALSAASASYAETSVGRVKTINMASSSVTLNDGSSYSFSGEAAKKLSGYRPGDSVQIQWVQRGKGHMGESIATTSVFHDVGTIASIDHNARVVTLADGKSYQFGRDEHSGKMLSGYNTGDKVRISYDTRGGMMRGESIGGTSAERVSGVIEKVDLATDSVTLAGGKTYTFDPSVKIRSQLAGFRTGDQVSIILTSDTSGQVAEAINPAAK